MKYENCCMSAFSPHITHIKVAQAFENAKKPENEGVSVSFKFLYDLYEKFKNQIARRIQAAQVLC